MISRNIERIPGESLDALECRVNRLVQDVRMEMRKKEMRGEIAYLSGYARKPLQDAMQQIADQLVRTLQVNGADALEAVYIAARDLSAKKSGFVYER